MVGSPFNYRNQKAATNSSIRPDSIIRRCESQGNGTTTSEDGDAERKRLSEESIESGFDEGEEHTKCGDDSKQTKDDLKLTEL